MENKNNEKVLKILNTHVNDNTKIYNKLGLFYKTLGYDIRIKILVLLLNKTLTVSEIATEIAFESSAISHQLKILKLNNFVSSEKKGKYVFYSLADNHIKDLIEIGLEHLLEKN